MAIRGLIKEPASVGADSTVADVDPAGVGPLVMPDLSSGAGIHGPNVIREGEVEDAVDHKRRCLHGSAASREPIGPGEGKRGDIVRVNLGQRAEPATRVIAMIDGP